MTNLEVCRVGTKAEICEIFAAVYFTMTTRLLEYLEINDVGELIAQSSSIRLAGAMFDWLDCPQDEPALTPTEAEAKIQSIRLALYGNKEEE